RRKTGRGALFARIPQKMAAFRRTYPGSRALPLRGGFHRGGVTARAVTPKASRPRPRRLGLVLEALDLVLHHHGEANVVEAFEQAFLAVRIDLEFDHAAVGAAD